MSSPFAPTRSRSSRRQFVLEFIRGHFRARGASPSYAEIAGAAGLKVQHVGRFLAELEGQGLLTRQRGASRAIALVDRLANFSDEELRLACIARGMTVTMSALPALSAAFRTPDDVMELGVPLVEALTHIA